MLAVQIRTIYERAIHSVSQEDLEKCRGKPGGTDLSSKKDCDHLVLAERTQYSHGNPAFIEIPTAVSSIN